MPFQRDIAILGGCGHVGLPLGLAFAERGLTVALHDINASAVETVGQGRMPFREEGADTLLPQLLEAGRLTVTTDAAVLGTAETVIVIVGTPVDQFLNPDIGAVLRALEPQLPRLVDGQLLVLRSTVYPGVTAMIEKRVAELDVHIDVAFCPERIAEGHALTELRSLPQIVAARSSRATERAAALCTGTSGPSGRAGRGPGRERSGARQRWRGPRARHPKGPRTMSEPCTEGRAGQGWATLAATSTAGVILVAVPAAVTV